MNNSRIYRRFAVVAIGLLLAGLVPSSVLAVGTVYVRPLVTPGGGSCDSPEYNSIQLAVNGTEAGSTIHICAGTYNLTGSIEVEEKPGDTFVGDAGAILDGAAIVEVNGKKSIIWSDSDITIVDLTFQNGSAASGGAVSAPANAVSVRGSTFVNNAATAGAGGAISAATVAISNSTFSGNSATGAGGAVAAATGSIVNVTFVGNTSVTGATAVSSTTSMTVTNSILADASSNCGGAGTFTDGGGNLSTDTSCTGFAGNSTSLASLHLGALANNDGPTQTIALDMALGANSVAINDGVDAVCTASPVNGLDQRGETRPSGAHCDSGAFEATLGAFHHLTISPINATITAGGSQVYAAEGYDSLGNDLGDRTSTSDFTIDGSPCTGASCTSTLVGAHTVTASNHADSSIQISTTLHVTHGTLVLLTIAPADQTIGAGGSQAYTAQGADDPGNRWDATGSSDFTITGAGSSCTVTTCTSTVPGDHTVTATDKANTSVSNSTTLHVTVGALHHLVLSPSSATIAVSGSQSYTAAGYDAYGNPLGDVTGSTTFTIGGASSSCTGTSCTSTLSGDHTVTGTDGAATGTATLHVSAGAATHLSVVGPTSPRAVDASGNVTVTALDAYENTATGYAGTVHFTSSDANATLPANGTLTSGVGTFSVAFGTVGTQSVTATDTVTPSITGSQTGIVVQTPIPATYHAITPVRILDTRDGTGGSSSPLTSHVARSFQVTTRGGVPDGATAVTGNLTVTQQSGGGYLYLGPIPVNNPSSSTLNFPVGDDRANAATVALGPGGTLSVTYVGSAGSPTAHVIFDATGYFTPDNSGATYHPLTPARILDSRNGTGGVSAKLSSHVAKSFQVTTRGGVPDGATAVTGNLTVTQQSGGGYFYLGPIPRNNPTSSTLTFPVGDDRANAVTVALGVGGSLSVTYVSGTAGAGAHVIFDVTGYFTGDMTGSKFVPLSPARILDTRDGTGGSSQALANHSARQFPVVGNGGVPSGAVAVTGNLTVTQQTKGGYLFLGNAATNDPSSSTLNFPVNDDRANAVTLPLGGGYLYVTYVGSAGGSTAHAIFDVTGYFIP